MSCTTSFRFTYDNRLLFCKLCLSAGIRKRDRFSDPIRRDSWQIQYLRNASSYFQQWKESNLPGLTSQTFTAFIQTTASLADFCQYFLEKDIFEYILLGYCQSDPIEGRFGRYRQLCGPNFYISVRQVAECEQKIRIMNLMEQNCDLREFNPSNESVSVSVPDWLTECLSNFNVFDLDTIESSQLNLLYYIAGYISRSIYRRQKCEACKEALISSETSSDEPTTSTHPQIINLCNRGGLSFPSEMAFVITCLGYCAFDAFMNNSCSKTSFLKLNYQRKTFVSAVEKRCSGDEFVKNLVTASCSSGHRPFRLIIHKVFNCLCNKFC